MALSFIVPSLRFVLAAIRGTFTARRREIVLEVTGANRRAPKRTYG